MMKTIKQLKEYPIDNHRTLGHHDSMKKRLTPIEACNRAVERAKNKLEAAQAKCKHKNFEKRHADIGDGYSIYEGGSIGSRYVTDCTCRNCGHCWRVEGSL